MQFQLLKFLGIAVLWFTIVVAIAFVPAGSQVAVSKPASSGVTGACATARNRILPSTPTRNAVFARSALPPRTVAASSSDSTSNSKDRHELSLTDVVRRTMSVHFGDTPLADKTLEQFAAGLPVESQFKKPAGVFVTLSRKGKTRACWGSIYPQHGSIAKATIYATLGALTKEYRFPPVKSWEWKALRSQVTVIKSIEPIESIRFQNPLRDGLMVRAGGKAGVLLPGEAADACYQLVQCKLKAGIKPGDTCQLYRLRTEIYD